MNQNESGGLRKSRDVNWGCFVQGLGLLLGWWFFRLGCLRGRRDLGVGVDVEVDVVERRAMLLKELVSFRAAVHASLISLDSTRILSVLCILIIGVIV